jgi:hypothetical protein
MSYWYTLEQLGRFHQQQLLAEAARERLIAAVARPVGERRTRPLRFSPPASGCCARPATTASGGSGVRSCT